MIKQVKCNLCRGYTTAYETKDSINVMSHGCLEKYKVKNWAEDNIYPLKEKSIKWEIGLIMLVVGLIIINI